MAFLLGSKMENFNEAASESTLFFTVIGTDDVSPGLISTNSAGFLAQVING
jgi:hypothetical protein